MSEPFTTEPAVPEQETLEQKIERLLPFLRESLDAFHSERPLKEGAITVTRTFKGEAQTLANLVVFGIDRNEGVEFGSFDAAGEPTSSAVISWADLLDVRSS